MKRERTLIVGPQGSGKTTLANKMMKGLNKTSIKKINAAGKTKWALENGCLIGVQCVYVKEFESEKQLTLFAKQFGLATTAVIFEYQGHVNDIPIATQDLFDEVIMLKDSPF